MYKKILVPLDGSILAEAVLPFVERVAQAEKSGVTLITVLEPPVEEMVEPSAQQREEGLVPHLDQVVERMTSYGKIYLKRVARRLKEKGIDVQDDVLLGRPATEIANYANKNGVDLVAMSTHGRGGITRWRYGSVANELLRSLTAPLFLLRSSGKASEASSYGSASQLLRVVVPLDGSKLAEQALAHARELASKLDLEIHLIRAVSQPTPAYMGPDAIDYYYDLDEILTREAAAYMASVAQQLEKEKFRVTVRVFHGFPAANIVDYAAAIGQSIICITTHGRTGIGRALLGSVADKVLQESESPVVMARAQGTQHDSNNALNRPTVSGPSAYLLPPHIQVERLILSYHFIPQASDGQPARRRLSDGPWDVAVLA